MRVTGWPAVVLILVQLAVGVWTIYLTVKIAQHVNAWPF